MYQFKYELASLRLYSADKIELIYCQNKYDITAFSCTDNHLLSFCHSPFHFNLYIPLNLSTFFMLMFVLNSRRALFTVIRFSVVLWLLPFKGKRLTSLAHVLLQVEFATVPQYKEESDVMWSEVSKRLFLSEHLSY